MASLPAPLLLLADPRSQERVQLAARLGARRFAMFFRMAWPNIDPAFLLWNWHLDLLCDEMELVARRVNTEVVCCIPPRSLKSQILSVAFPAWVWTWFPAAKFITGSNEMTLATRDAVKTRRLIESDWYQKRWGPDSPFLETLSSGDPHPGVRLSSDQNNKTYYETDAGGHRFCCTPGSNVTGHGGDFVTCDDPHPTQRAESANERENVIRWWTEAIPTRLNEPDRGAKMVVQQRVHEEDLAGNCIAAGYHKVVLPMEFEADHPHRHPKDPRTIEGELLHPARVSGEGLARLKRALGSYGVAGQLQQRPAPRAGGMFQKSWFTIVDAVPAECAHNRVRRWDLASTAPAAGKDPDYTAGGVVSKDSFGRIYIEDVRRARVTPTMVDQMIKGTVTQDPPNIRLVISQDPGQAGVAQKEAMVRFLAPHPVSFVKETGDKTTRARGLASQAEAGNVYLVRGAWNDEFLKEITAFPNATHDDQVDCVVGGYTDLFGGTTGLLDFMRAQVDGLHQ